MTDNIKLPPMPKAHTVVKPKDSEPFGLITTRDALNFAAEAVRLNAQTEPDGWKLVPVEPTPEMLDAANLARKYREHGALTDPDVLNSRTYNSRQTYTAMLSAAPAAPQPAQQDAKPIYQYQLSTGGWIDQPRDSYEYYKANGVKGLRIVYEAAPQPAQPLTDEQAASLAKQLGWDTMPERFPLIVRAVEQAHGIGVKP